MQIEYQEPVRQSGDMFSLRVPLVVGAALQSRTGRADRRLRGPTGTAGASVTDPVPDRDRIEPPVLDPRAHAPVNPVSHHGAPAGRLPARRGEEPPPRGRDRDAGDGRRVIKLADGPVPADRDFELTWKPAAGTAPSVGLFRERVGDADYLLAFVTPPVRRQTPRQPRPREIVFVIDNSGSMGGTSMVQAKASLDLRARPAAARPTAST